MPAPAPSSATSAPRQSQPPRPAQAHAPSVVGDVKVGSVTIKIGRSFGDDRGRQIVDAVGLLPDLIRAKVDGVTFSFMGGTTGPDGRGLPGGHGHRPRLWGHVRRVALPDRRGHPACTDTATSQHVAVLSKFPLNGILRALPGREGYSRELND